MDKLEFHIIPLEELHDANMECNCGYEVMGFSNGIIVIHQPEASAFEELMSSLDSFREWQLCQVI